MVQQEDMTPVYSDRHFAPTSFWNTTSKSTKKCDGEYSLPYE